MLREHPGVPIMLQPGDDEWLREKYPGLMATGDGLGGSINFRARYDPTINQFYAIEAGSAEPTGALILSGDFQIRIEPRSDQSTSRLPALRVENIDPIADRHFGADKSACLCSPLEEDAFLQPEFQFRKFIEQLVVPFLYGQVYFSSHNRWPWSEYAHGAAGLLEAYANAKDSARAAECLRLISQDSNWGRIRSALLQKPYVKGHNPCFCSSGEKARHCHPTALQGALLLQRDLEGQEIAIPQTRTRS